MIFSRSASQRVFRPIIADLQQEYFEAVENNHPEALHWILLRGRLGFVMTVFTYIAINWRHVLFGEREMKQHLPMANRPLSLMFALGTLGAVIIAGSAQWITNGIMILIPYALFMVGVGVVLRSAGVESYRDRFVVGLGAFMMASLALYLWVALVFMPHVDHHYPYVSFLGHAWRVGALLLIGILVCAPLAVVSVSPWKEVAR